MGAFLLKDVVDHLNKNGLEMTMAVEENFARTSSKIEVENKIDIRIYKDTNEIGASIEILGIPECIIHVIILEISLGVKKHSKAANIRTWRKERVEISVNFSENISSHDFANVVLSFFNHYKKIIENQEIKEAIKKINESYGLILLEQNHISLLLPKIK